MQNQTPNSTDGKQYFDIKNPSTPPDPTSRPVINSDPLQPDPMVSATDQGQASQQPITEDFTAADIPDVPGADPSSVVYEVPSPPVEPDNANETGQAQAAAVVSTTLNQPQPVQAQAQPIQAEATNEAINSSSQPVTPPAQPTPSVQAPLETVQSTPQVITSIHKKSSSQIRKIKIIVGIFILIALIVGAFLVHKYKVGK